MFHHTAFATRDPAATHAFYTQAMGFELVKVEVAPTPKGGWAKHFFYDTGGGELMAFWDLHDDTIPDTWSPAISTGLGALIPIIPFFFLTGIAAVLWAAGISLVAHFAVGAAKTLITGRSVFVSGMEMTIVGAVEAAITYSLGLLFHASGA